jgi:hypothetical protein
LPFRVQSIFVGLVGSSDPGNCGTVRAFVSDMSKLLRGVAAGYGAKKLGGGCFSTIIIFIILWWLLGNFGIFK